jgi:hypothetical protein
MQKKINPRAKPFIAKLKTQGEVSRGREKVR